MTAFVTLAGVYNTPDITSNFGVERSRDQDLMTTSRALDQFLASVEKRAFKIAQLGLRNDDDALDAVQDSMMKLVQSYASRSRRGMAAVVLPHPRESHSRHAAAAHGARPHHGLVAGARRGRRRRIRSHRARRRATMPVRLKRLELDEAIGVLETAVAELPPRQQQAFLLRNFEGLDVNETASAMGCSEGSVKTHYFRALESLRAKLGEVF